jgi:hypothetical protein
MQPLPLVVFACGLASCEPRAKSAPSEAGGPAAELAGHDPFGVRELYPTVAGGREWYLPPDADRPDAEWFPEYIRVTRVAKGVFRASGQVRLSVRSPAGKAWWRNVEMTAYLRRSGPAASDGQPPHWELYARGERHSTKSVDATQINDGVAAPPGTPTWPGYPFHGAVDPHCLGSAYHGFVGVDGAVHVEKEVTHVSGYAPPRGATTVSGLGDGPSHFFGVKVIVRNAHADAHVRTEVWLDAAGDGTWSLVASVLDDGDWRAPSLDGCESSPFGYTNSTVLAWASPWVTFRSDSMETEFKWLSVREIAPLP